MSHPAVDVLIIAALREELAALLEVSEGRREGWTWVEHDPPYHVATFDAEHGPIRVAAAHVTRMAGVATAVVSATLTSLLRPRALAMCGVCAGHPEHTSVGDVVIADRVFTHDHGKRKSKGFAGDLWVRSINESWLRVAQGYARAAVGLYGYAKPDAQVGRWWFLDQLLAERNPLKSVARVRFIPDESRVAQLSALRDLGYVTFDGEVPQLSAAGRAAAHEHRNIHGSAVTTTPYHIHVGAMGSGNYVVGDPIIWEQLAEGGMRKTLAVEMEAAAIGELAHAKALPFVVVKGVMDHADRHKADGVKAFAARVSAEVLCHFIRRVIEPARVQARSHSPRFEGPGASTARRLTGFHGRGHELVELERLLVDNRRVVTQGVGGVGKSTLAEAFVATRGPTLFPEGTVWLEGGRLVAELARVARRFGWAGERDPTPDEALAWLTRELAELRVMVVVDDFDPEVDALAHVPRPRGRARTLVTTRARSLDVDLGAAKLELKLWTGASCRQYLRERCGWLAGAADRELDALAVFVGRLPLGLRLLVSLLHKRRDLDSVGVLRLLERQPLGALEGHRAAQRGIAATFELSYPADDDPRRRVLQAVAVCAKHTRTEIVGAIAEVEDAGALLADLHVRGLIELATEGAPAWSLHDVLRMFVLDQPERERFEAAHLAWVRAHLETHADHRAHVEFSVGVAEAHVAVERLLGQDLEQVSVVYRPLVDHLFQIGRHTEVLELAESLRAAAPEGSKLAATAMIDLGYSYERLRGPSKALGFYERALAIAETLVDPGILAPSLTNLGRCYRGLGELPKAIEFHERALSIYETLGALAPQAIAVGSLGVCYQGLGEFPKAIEFHERALSINEGLGRLEGQAGQLGNLGLCYRMLGELPKAIEFHERSLAINESLGHPGGQAAQLGNLGACYRTLGEHPKAIEFVERALGVSETLGDLEGQANQLGNLGLLEVDRGARTRARDYFTRALELYRRIELPDTHPTIVKLKASLSPMSVNLPRPQASTDRVEDLVKLVVSGRVRIPTFQRDLAWEASDVVALFDSIYRGYPIGSLLFYSKPARAQSLELGPLEIPAPETESALWVIDGQQRLISLAVSLHRPTPIPTTPDDAWVVYFDPVDQSFCSPPKDGKLPTTWVPLAEMLDNSNLSEWVHRWPHCDDAALRKVVFDAGSRIREYPVPSYTVDTDSEEILHDIFHRINKFGKALTWQEIHDGLYGGDSDPSQPSRLGELADALVAVGMGRPREQAQLLPCLVAYEGHDVTRSFEELQRLEPQFLAGTAAAAMPTLRRVLGFLRADARIPHLKLLPQSAPLPILTRFFRFHPEPSARSRELLTRWLWRSILAAGSFNELTFQQRGVRDIDARDEEGSVQRLLALVPKHIPPPFQLPECFDARAPDSRIAALGLCSLGPRSLTSGRVLDIASVIENASSDAFRIIIADGPTLASGAANRSLLSGSGLAHRQIIQAVDDAALRSHAISDTGAAALRAGDAAAFLSDRARILEAQCNTHALAMADWSGNDRPSLEYVMHQGVVTAHAQGV